MSNKTAIAIVEGFAQAADVVARAGQAEGNAALHAGAGVAGVILREVARLLEDRTPDEALAILISIRDHGAQPITKEELDAQVAAAVAKLGD